MGAWGKSITEYSNCPKDFVNDCSFIKSMHDGYRDENHLNMISSQNVTTQNDGYFLQQRFREDANSSASVA